MSIGAILFMIIGLTVTWGGAAVCIAIAMRCRK
ncbi:MAG: MetS family NSS transporter small subunit [Spirochaeta sp.]|jgi:hypothetical protein|nr:MetS family NSS transporter small subunit [Spirochaeta sp.]